MTTPQLSDYDFVVINTSAGKDSQTTLRFVLAQAEKEGYPRAQIVAAHADLGRIEWPGSSELAERQVREFYPGLRFWKLARPQGDLLAHIASRGKFPSSSARYCTSDHKRGQIAKLFTRLAAELSRPDGRPVRILNCLGMRAEESPARAVLRPFAANRRETNGVRVVDNWLPIHAWQLPDVWADIRGSGVPHHRAYDLGMPRLSCVFCIFSPPQALMIAGRQNPDLLAEYVRVEREIGHNLRKDFPISRVADAIAAGEDWGAATDWVM